MIENLKIRGLILTVVGAISWLAIYILIPSPIDVQYVPVNIQLWVEVVSGVISFPIVIVSLVLYLRTKSDFQYSTFPLLFLPFSLLYSLGRVLVSMIFHPDYVVGISLEALRHGLLWTVSIILMHLFLRGVDWEEIAGKETYKRAPKYDDTFEEENGSG